MRRSFLFLAATAAAASLTLTGCSSSADADAAPSAANTDGWTSLGTITKDQAADNATVKEVQTFLTRVPDSGTVITRIPQRGDQQAAYEMVAAMDGARYTALYKTNDGATWASGDGTQWCTTGTLEAGVDPTDKDWTCQPGKPAGGNEYEQVMGYGWLASDPVLYFGGGVQGYEATSADIERKGDTIRFTFRGLPTGDGIVTYDMPMKTITQATDDGDDPLVIQWSSDLPKEWPTLPPIQPVSDEPIPTASAAAEPAS